MKRAQLHLENDDKRRGTGLNLGKRNGHSTKTLKVLYIGDYAIRRSWLTPTTSD
jgi:hypothetical protein